MSIGIVGGGWAGLSAAVHATDLGHRVTLYETARQLGGRAREVPLNGIALDNGQHVLIGAYQDTLALMRRVGVSEKDALLRLPLQLVYPDGEGLMLKEGPAALEFVRAALACRRWTRREKLALLISAFRWWARGFRCAANLTVHGLTAQWPDRLRNELIDPLCVAALNTPSTLASAKVFLRVLRDTLFSGAGAADLLLPRLSLSGLLPIPAQAWLQARAAVVRCGQRVQSLHRLNGAWQVDQDRHDAVILTCSANEAGRLAESIAPAWSLQAGALRYEPIVTAYLSSHGTRLLCPMMALQAASDAPAQFVFDLGAIRGEAARGIFAFVVSGASEWIERGADACGEAIISQAQSAFAHGTWRSPPSLLGMRAEKRATFLSTPELQRPQAMIAPSLWAAGDYVEGPYPATLEGAVRSGREAAFGLHASAPVTSSR